MLPERPRIFKAGEQKRDFVSIEDVLAVNLLGDWLRDRLDPKLRQV